MWSEQMHSDLLECKRKATTLISSDDLLRADNGRKKRCMKIMKELWDE